MAEKIGRKLVIKKGGTAIAAVRTKGVSWSGEPIDVTSDDAAGFRKLLSDAQGQEQIDLSVEGVMTDNILRDIALAPATTKYLTDITLVWSDTLESISGDFMLASYEESAPYNEAITFTASLQSSGQWVYTPAA